ncbi:MAG: exodeoxyribonuclease VII small subunit [Acidimicrobiales bacterium]|nr:exodeoxyribonuclease VII small subunit [Acidimicrobiales bacterium]
MAAEPPVERYEDALGELESILAELEGDDLDVDVLTTRVARAADLLAWCRARLRAVELDVERIVVTLGDTGPDSEPTGRDREDGGDGRSEAP